MLDLFTASLLDPFRAGLIVALFLTALRTRHDTGMVLPLGVGLVFVAAIIPITRGATPLLQTIAMGLAANIILMGIVLGLWAIVARR
jgi:hypothetical protein